MRALLCAQILALVALASTALANPIASDRIVGGNLAQKAIPYIVSIQSENNSHLCGGFIYNNKWVITVASCVVNKPSSSLKISINDYKFINLNEPGEQKVTVYRIIVNDRYNETTKENDIALLELSQKLDLTPIKENDPLANASCVRYDEVPSYVTGTVSGWGLLEPEGLETATLHTGYVKVEKSNECNETVYPYFATPTMICASSQENPDVPDLITVPCTKDEGSPLVIDVDGEPLVVGLFSYNDECQEETPSVFTRISAYYSWIGNTAGPQPDNCYQNPAPAAAALSDDESLPGDENHGISF